MHYNKLIVLEYLGTNYAGWQVQTNGVTVQEELQKALSRMYKHKINAAGSGRTDSGVHALGQTASFCSDRYIEPENVRMGLNSLLPDDIAVLSVKDVPEDFHAQHSAKSKTYLYRIYASYIRSAMHWGRTWWVKDELDHKEIDRRLKLLIGEHDFSSFCVQTSLRENNVRRINSAECFMDGDIICIEINGNGFLHNMVRIIVGTIVESVRKGYPPEHIREVLEAKNRDAAGITAHAEGLYLKEVFY